MNLKTTIMAALGYIVFFLLGTAFALLFIAKDKPKSPALSSQVKKIDAAMAHQLNASYRLTSLFLEYETVIHRYIKQPSIENKRALTQTMQALDKQLATVSKLYGLEVKRWASLFQVWQLCFLQKLFQAPAKQKDGLWVGMLLMYQQGLGQAIKAVQQHYNNVALNTLLSPLPPSTNTHDKTAVKQVESIYQAHAKTWAPKALELYTTHQRATDCLPPILDIQKPKSVVFNVVFIQYAGRACPFMASKPTRLCKKLSRTPEIGRQKKINDLLAVCAVGNHLLAQEAKKAKTHYGHLTYAQYFNQFVKPLVPKYQTILKEQSASSNAKAAYYACTLKQLPVVAFRDPVVDAKIAAYEMYGYLYCHKSFARNSSSYAQYQKIRYQQSLKRQAKQRYKVY